MCAYKILFFSGELPVKCAAREHLACKSIISLQLVGYRSLVRRVICPKCSYVDSEMWR